MCFCTSLTGASTAILAAIIIASLLDIMDNPLSSEVADIRQWNKLEVKKWATDLFDEETGKKFDGKVYVVS